MTIKSMMGKSCLRWRALPRAGGKHLYVDGVVARAHAFIKIHRTALKICTLYYVLCIIMYLCYVC